jgi:hypothetical protein
MVFIVYEGGGKKSKRRRGREGQETDAGRQGKEEGRSQKKSKRNYLFCFSIVRDFRG